MTHFVSGAAEPTLARVGVTLTDWTPEGPVVVRRVHQDGQRHDMRAMSSVSGGVAFGFDYETPLSVPFHYEADRVRHNEIANPGFEVNTTGWTAGTGTTLTRDTVEHNSGVASGKIDTVISASGPNIFTTSNATAAAGQKWIGSCYAKGAGTCQVVLQARQGSSTLATYTSGAVTMTSSFQRVSMTSPALPANTDNVRMLVQQGSTGVARTMYADDILLERGDALMPFITTDTVATESSPDVTLTIAQRSLLTVPGIPVMGGPITLMTRPETERARPQVALDIFGRTTRIIKSDVMKAPQFELTLLTRSDNEAYTLTAMLAIAPVLMLRVPGLRVLDWCYIQVGGVKEVPVMRVLPPTIPTPGDITTWAAWAVPCEVVEAPVGGSIGDPTSTWQRLKDTGLTWQQLKDMNLTWLQILQGQAVS